MAYSPAAEIQRQTLERVIVGESPNTLFFVEHDPVLTLGANFHPKNLLLAPERYAELGIEVLPTDRGGDVTYHGPGQLVIYPVFNVADLGQDLHRWLRDLEQVIIQALNPFGLEAYRFPPHTGVWVSGRKIASIGIKVRRWVSMHGIALNCNCDLGFFETIVPCGIEVYGVTSLTQETGAETTIEMAKPFVQKAFEDVFRLEFDSK